jgi:7-carboxy-7-deazaguanine synthase
MTYTVKEIFKTLQGEGFHTGRVAVFCRFAGCNLWSGREDDRATAQCRFCDTDFVGGVKYQAASDLAAAIEAEWGPNLQSRMVVLTGGEPALQFDQALKEALHARHFYIAVETNGTVLLRANPQWICLSPKAGTALVLQAVDEVKVVFPQDGFDPAIEDCWC